MMPVMVRVLFALVFEACLLVVTQQRPAPPSPLNVNYELVCEPLLKGCRLITRPSEDSTDTQNQGIELVPDRQEVRVDPGHEATLTCHVNTQHDRAYIKTVWYKWTVYKHTGEWKWQGRRTTFTGDDMSLTITGAEETTRYRCKACVTDQPADSYSAHYSADDTSCTVAEIQVKKDGRD
ncbi:hypothetical protein ACHWQZ_G001875 [Mnemiopsis leidyi]